jgi:hypothetical protein
VAGHVKGFASHGGLHQLVAPKSDEGGTRLAWWMRVCAEDLSASSPTKSVSDVLTPCRALAPERGCVKDQPQQLRKTSLLEYA